MLESKQRINLVMPRKRVNKLSKLQKVIGLLGVFLVVIGAVLGITNSLAALVPVKSVEITSEQLDYQKKESGSFNVEKSAEWISRGKARITFDVDTIIKTDDKNTDIIFVLDISGSMDGDKLTRVKEDSIDLINTVLSDSNNRGALITFETNSELVLPLTNDKETLVNTINGLTTGNNTNYYRPLINVDEILKNYKKETNRECIVLFLTDGYPNEDVPNEEGQYQYLKRQYPYLTINGVQYEMGSDVLDPVKKVSDQQFIADMTNLNNVLFEASVAPITYDSFSITDYINNDYFEIDSIDNIVASIGATKLEYENNTPKVIWNIENLRSGSKATLTIDVKLKDEFINKGGLYPTNKKEEINTEIDKIKEDITSDKTPILSSHYQVIYDGNAPDGCNVQNIPDVTNKAVFETVEISNQSATCNGYQFKRWAIVTEDVKRINDNYFEMPRKDVVLRAVWGRMDIAKSMDGEVYVAPPPIIRKVSQFDNWKLWKYKASITKIVFENSISDKDNAIETFDISEGNNASVIAHIVPNDDNTTYTAYIEGNEKVIANGDSSYLFNNFSNLTTIEGFEYFDTSQVTNMTYMFAYCSNLTSLDLSNFDTSNVTSMNGMFSRCVSLTTLDLSNFDTRNVTNMSFMFEDCSGLTSLDISNFDTSNVTNMEGMFEGCRSFVGLDLSNLDTSSVTTMKAMFSYCVSLTNLDLSNFDTSNVTDMIYMFDECTSLINLDLSSFDTSKVKYMSYMFSRCRSLINLDLSNFDTSSVTTMRDMFNVCISLTNLDLNSFDTSKVKDMCEMFYNCRNLVSLDLSSFDTSSVTNMSYMFHFCNNLTTSLMIMNSETLTITRMFYGTATTSGSQITVNYTTETSDLVDQMIETKSSDSNVVKGELVS